MATITNITTVNVTVVDIYGKVHDIAPNAHIILPNRSLSPDAIHYCIDNGWITIEGFNNSDQDAGTNPSCTSNTSETTQLAVKTAVESLLTDSQLRAAPLTVHVDNLPAPVESSPVLVQFPEVQAVSGPLTNAQLRAAPIPVVIENLPAYEPVSIQFPDTQPVSGPLTNAELRTSAIAVKLFAPTTSDWTYTGILTNNTNTPMKAGTPGLTNYLTGFQFQNNNTVAASIAIRDGNTAIWHGHAPANMPVPASIVFQTPLKATTGAALNIQCNATGARIFINSQGYQI